MQDNDSLKKCTSRLIIYSLIKTLVSPEDTKKMLYNTHEFVMNPQIASIHQTTCYPNSINEFNRFRQMLFNSGIVFCSCRDGQIIMRARCTSTLSSTSSTITHSVGAAQNRWLSKQGYSLAKRANKSGDISRRTNAADGTVPGIKWSNHQPSLSVSSLKLTQARRWHGKKTACRINV